MTQIQLSDTQAVILSAACGRDSRLVFPVIANLKGGAVGNVLKSLLKKGLIEEVPATDDNTVWRHGNDDTPLTLRATSAAYEALDIVGDAGADTAPEDESAADTANTTETQPTGAHGAPEAKPARKTREGTKQETLIALLKHPEGASIEEISSEFGWAHHTVRGAIAGALKKKLGLAVTSEKVEARGRVYRIAE
ncbi:DUF3489 domain-containing protein [Magnetospirillum sp. UT-4]|uniref:DUF3489 domain-containing protein n=1 Tax=Magnetospirillum sp. UT-4 TaxID=2681467 RepID=UPI00137EF849|nr:DUF3489 domain-containing protein [Magnetospirillum sp. UT-4]CAA7615732.1 conserved hypothetical protein [Magnetospirillum sp. UT-4]